MGHRVVAAEPTEEMRCGAMALHPSPLIEWLDDSLPDLASLRARGEQFDVVMLTAVWVHLHEQQRRRANAHVSALGGGGGGLIITPPPRPGPPGKGLVEGSG